MIQFLIFDPYKTIIDIEIILSQIEHFIESPDLLGTLFFATTLLDTLYIYGSWALYHFNLTYCTKGLVHWMCHPCWSSTHAQKMWFHDDLIWQSAYCLLFYRGPHTTLRIAWLIIICHCYTEIFVYKVKKANWSEFPFSTLAFLSA